MPQGHELGTCFSLEIKSLHQKKKKSTSAQRVCTCQEWDIIGYKWSSLSCFGHVSMLLQVCAQCVRRSERLVVTSRMLVLVMWTVEVIRLMVVVAMGDDRVLNGLTL